MTSLRSGPLPRMAGDLTFMRSTRGCVEDLTSNSLAIVGIPMEENTGADVGCRMTPQAIRETSVYFGWHANPQFSHPVDVDVRKQISTSSIHERMTDIGDIPVEGLATLLRPMLSKKPSVRSGIVVRQVSCCPETLVL